MKTRRGGARRVRQSTVATKAAVAHELSCAECEYVANSPMALGRHLRFKHGVPGKHSKGPKKSGRGPGRPKGKPGRKRQPSLDEAIMALRLEVEAIQGVIKRLESML